MIIEIHLKQKLSSPFLHHLPSSTMADCRNLKNNRTQKTEKPWGLFRVLFSCRHLQNSARQGLLRKEKEEEEWVKKCKKMKCFSGSLCNSTKVMQRPETGSPEVYKKRALMASSNSYITDSSSSTRSMKSSVYEQNGVIPTSFSSSSATSIAAFGGSFRGIPFRKISGCYECKMVIDPVLGYTKDSSLRSSIFPCPQCRKIFMKSEILELHLTINHAVSELDEEDTSKNIVEIIFKSSWMKKEPQICKIERVLKVHNTQKTLSKFEEYRDTIKAKATKLQKKNPRCLADGNELLRFHCTTLACSLGVNGCSSLCHSIHPHCSICSIIRSGFRLAEKGILTMAASGAAHDRAREAVESNEKRAMVVCRVVAGRVKRSGEGSMEEYDSVSGGVEVYSNLDELYVFNAEAILPCFVVIYQSIKGNV